MIKSRLTHAFVEIKTQQQETILFKKYDDPTQTLENLMDVVEDICNLYEFEFEYKITKTKHNE